MLEVITEILDAEEKARAIVSQAKEKADELRRDVEAEERELVAEARRKADELFKERVEAARREADSRYQQEIHHQTESDRRFESTRRSALESAVSAVVEIISRPAYDEE